LRGRFLSPSSYNPSPVLMEEVMFLLCGRRPPIEAPTTISSQDAFFLFFLSCSISSFNSPRLHSPPSLKIVPLFMLTVFCPASNPFFFLPYLGVHPGELSCPPLSASNTPPAGSYFFPFFSPSQTGRTSLVLILRHCLSPPTKKFFSIICKPIPCSCRSLLRFFFRAPR